MAFRACTNSKYSKLLLLRYRSLNKCQICSVGTVDTEKIVIPNRIKRDNLSILKALASTVKLDHSGPGYKYIDDPYLIPHTNTEKRQFSLSKISGQKAAQFVIQKFPKNFAHDTAVPPIEAFIPKTGPSLSDSSIEGLQERIELRRSIEAYDCYMKVLDAGLSVPQSIVEDLLDLLCCYNSQNPPESLFPEELFFNREGPDDVQNNLKKDKWKNDGAAETLFKQMSNPSARSICSIIRGRAKYFQGSEAYILFTELEEKGMRACVRTYNSILHNIPYIKNDSEERWELVLNLLKKMASEGVWPNLETFNSVLFTLSKSNRHKEARNWMNQTLNEMKRCQIEPSLTSMYYTLLISYPNRDSESRLLYDIVDQLTGKEFVAEEATDYEFFNLAMNKCFQNLKDPHLAYKLDEVVNHANNSLLLGDNYRTQIYHTNFLKLLLMFERLDKAMIQYNKVVPHLYTPTFTIFEEILTSISLNDGHRYIPKIWSDLVLFRYVRRGHLTELLVSAMVQKKHDVKLQELFVTIANNIIAIFEDDRQNKNVLQPFMLTGRLIGDIALIHLTAGNSEKAWDIMNLYIRHQKSMQGFPSEESLVQLCKEFVKGKDIDKTMTILSLMSDFGYPKMQELIEKVRSTMDLNDHQRIRLEDMI